MLFFSLQFDPTIEDAYRQQAEIDGIASMLEIYDTAGQEEFSSLRDTYIKAAEGFLLVYAVTSSRTYQHAQKLLTHIHKMKAPDVPIVLIGNKKDLEDARETEYDDGYNFSVQNSIGFLETSAKTAEHVQDAFHSLVRLVRKARENAPPPVEAKKKCVLL